MAGTGACRAGQQRGDDPTGLHDPGEVHGKAKHGAAYGYTKVRLHHPLVATPTPVKVDARLRKGPPSGASVSLRN